MKTNIYKKIFGLALMAMPLTAAAQTTLCTFDADDYGTLSVFDSWDDSPFVTGALQGNVAVVSNPAPNEGNSTAKVLGVQRSRFGSNKFGAKIRLKTPFELTTATRYVHVLINKPVAGRVMLIGLGKRDNRAAQSDQVEQFWALSTVPAAVGQWYDAVFAVKGNGGISISSLVVVPDCESSHALADDFIAYIDEIEIGDTPEPRFRASDLSTNATATSARSTICRISVTARNGDVLKADGSVLSGASVPSGQPLTIWMQPAPGFRQNGISVRHGHLSGDSLVNGIPQWKTVQVPANLFRKNRYTLPASYMDGDVEITAEFAEKKSTSSAANRVPNLNNAASAYTMVWHDEFDAANGTPADTTKWGRCPRQSATWSRLLSDVAEVCFQQNGHLVLRAIPNRDTSKDNAAMLTGGVQSRGKFSFLHGRIECRALVHPHEGNFPAIWLMPEDHSDGWPACGEIDIMEQINTENRAYHTVHTHWTYTLGHRNDAAPKTSFNETVDMNQYHIYALEWTKDSLFWFVDGTPTGFYGREPAYATQKQWPYDKAFYIILNQSVGDGTWASSPDLAHTYEMNVDWVRVYRKNEADNISGLQTQTPQHVQVD